VPEGVARQTEHTHTHTHTHTTHTKTLRLLLDTASTPRNEPQAFDKFLEFLITNNMLFPILVDLPLRAVSNISDMLMGISLS